MQIFNNRRCPRAPKPNIFYIRKFESNFHNSLQRQDDDNKLTIKANKLYMEIESVKQVFYAFLLSMIIIQKRLSFSPLVARALVI